MGGNFYQEMAAGHHLQKIGMIPSSYIYTIFLSIKIANYYCLFMIYFI